MGAMVWPMPTLAAPLAVSAQQANDTATGVVKDEFGDPMIGASVRVANNPKQGAATNIDGEFNIAGVKPGTKLQITSVGYKPVEIVWNGTPLDIDMELNTKMLDAVVVTAMGIQREEKTLTYAVQTIKNDEVTRIKETNFVNALQGKSAGLSITPNNSGAGGGASRIVLRGSTSILGSNNPLIVVDGVPMQSGPQGQVADGIDVGGGKSGDDILSTINPEDIENMTILKGPNAAALYGAAANNGVIVITTKSGAEGTVKVDISSSTSIDRIAMYPRQQQYYGISGNSSTQFNQYAAWGPRIGTRSADEIASQPWLRNSARESINDFFQTGVTLNNGITLSGGTENSRTYFSYNNTYQSGIVPGNKFMRNNVMLKETFALFNKKVNIATSLNWIHQRTDNQPVVGKALSSVFALYRTPADVDMRYFKANYYHPGVAGEFATDVVTGNPKLIGLPVQTWNWNVEYLNNPWWVTNMVNDKNKRDRIFGNITLDWKIWQNLKYQTRFSVDMVFDNGLNEEYATMYRPFFAPKGGKYYSSNSRTSDIYNDHMVTWNDRFADKFDVNVAAGGSFTRHYSRNSSITTSIDTSGVPNMFLPSNANSKKDGVTVGSATGAGDSWDYTDWSSALFVTASVGLWDKVYVDGSYRRDWCQAFQQFTDKGDYLSFGYWSVGANVLIDKFFNKDHQAAPWLDQLKWRGSYSVVGNAVPNQFFGRQSVNPSDGSIGVKPPTFDDPKPETTKAFETGLDMWFFNNKFNLDVTYYNSTLQNQFLWIETNAGSKPVNTGKIRNTGVEISAGYRWAINKNWTWQTNANFAYNDNKILETYIQDNGVPYIYEVGPKAFHVKYLEGGKFGDIYVNSFSRDANGQIVVPYGQDANGNIDYLNAVPSMESGKYETYVGNTASPYQVGWSNTLTFKNWTLYFLIDGRIGGKVMSLTEPDLDRFGISTRSADYRLAAENNPDLQYYTPDGEKVLLMYLPDGSGRKISVQRYFETIGQNPMEDHVYNATNFRMRDISLSYSLPNLFGTSKGMTAQFSVKNAFFLYKDSPVDPDISVSAASGFSGIDSYALPTLRSYCITLKFNF